MLKPISVNDLKIGMHVVLPASWLEHPFLKNHFNVESQEQIDKIIESSFSEVIIDTEKSLSKNEPESIVDSHIHISPPEKWEPEKLVPDELREAIRDKTLNFGKKAKIVYSCSLRIMERLLEDPKAENISEAKKGIAEIVDLIISDDATALSLLSITSYDFSTYTHSVNVGVLSVLLSKALLKNSNAHDMHELGAGFFLHDIGKVRLDLGLINKPGKLNDDEMNKIRTHPYQGYKILSETKQLTEECKIVVLQHHEREDGSGYPNRIKGNDIHIYARICSIADVYDALTAERSYRQKLNPFEALKVMKEELIHHFQRDLFEQFVMLFK